MDDDLRLQALKPCPFCGHEAACTTRHEGDIVFYSVRCTYTGCPVRPHTQWHGNMEKVVDLWNIRYDCPEPVTTVAPQVGSKKRTKVVKLTDSGNLEGS